VKETRMSTTIDPEEVDDFLSQHCIAAVGASDDPKKFGGTIYRALKAHGHNVVPVNRSTSTVDGDVCYPSLAVVPGDLDGVLVMVHRDDAAQVVRECIDRGIPRIWLFKGLGGASAVSDEAVDLCHENNVTVIAGACPMMFLEPVAAFHKVHRSMRHLNGSLAKAS
jgi:predicted CoA-binding protein